jgi:Reverse transcriptase (RNA-dependent DNA polymerase)
MRSFSITKLGSSQANQRQTNSLPCAKSLKKEMSTTSKFMHHLFIDFKAAYDTLIRHKVYVSMSELSFPTKLIRLTAATLNTLLCCVKIQNDCSEYFETRQGYVLSTLIFRSLAASKTTAKRHCNTQTQIGDADDSTLSIGAKQLSERRF